MSRLTPFFLCLSITLLSACNNGGGNNDEIIPTNIAINVSSIFLQGNYSLNGGSFPASQYENGLIYLADSEGNQTTLGNTYSGAYAANFVAGTYNSQYRMTQGGNTVPANQNNDIATGLVLQNDQALNISVTAFSVRFVFTLNGGAFPVSEYDDAVFYLQRTDGGDRILLGNSHSTIDPVWLMPGTYDVIYEVETPGSVVPFNQNAVVDTVVITDGSGKNVNITTVDFRLTATLDGGAFPVSQYQDGDFILLNSAGDRVELGATYELPLVVTVIEGTYNIIYAHESGTDVPANTEAILVSSQPIDTGNPAASLDIQTALITPEYTLDGNPFPNSEYQDANVLLRAENNSNDQFSLGNTHDITPAAVRVILGNYDVIYQHETGDQVPQNTNAVVADNVLLDMDQTLPVSLTSVDITGIFTLNGSNFTISQIQVAEFYLKGTEPGDELLLGFSYHGDGTAKIIPGTYDVVYKHTDGNNIPRNPENTIMSSLLLDTTQSIRINVLGTYIAPVFTLNNIAFPNDNNEIASFYLHGDSPADRIYIGRSHISQNVNAFVINDNYDVMYEYLKGSSIPINDSKLVTNIDIP